MTLERLPRLEAVEDTLTEARIRVRARATQTAVTGACLLIGLAAVSVAVGMIYLPAGILIGGLELVAGAVVYTLGASRIPSSDQAAARRSARRTGRHPWWRR